MEYPVVTIVIPTLNEGAYIERCLNSVKNLEYPKDKYSIVIVDNGSKDDTLKKVKAFTSNILQQPPSTISLSRNAGAASGQSDIIAFLDADCVVSPLWLNNALQRLIDQSAIGVGSYPAVLINESNKLQILLSKIARGRTCRKAAWLPSSNFIVKRWAFEKVGGFDESLITCEDADIGYRLSQIGGLVWDPNVLVYHLREPKNFNELFKKEVWRSQNSINGVMRHGLRWAEIPSIAAPAIFGVSVILVILGVFFSGCLFLGGLLSLLAITVLFSFRAFFNCGVFIAAIPVYVIYFSARAYSMFKSILSSLVWKLRH